MKNTRIGLQWDKSLYTKINAATQTEVNRVNALAQVEFPQEYENEWGNRTTLRAKTDYLIELRLADQRRHRP